MNTPIEDFAQAPQRDKGYYTHNNEVADQVFKFLEEESPVREYCVSKPMVNVLSKTYIIEHDEGTAYQVHNLLYFYIGMLLVIKLMMTKEELTQMTLNMKLKR